MSPFPSIVRSAALAAAVVGSTCFFARTAHAADHVEATLSYEAPSRCAPPGDFEARVAARLGYDPFVSDAGRAVVVHVRATGAAWKARVAIAEDGGRTSGNRELTSTVSCDDLAATLAVSVALALDPEAALHVSSPTSGPERTPDRSQANATPASSVPASRAPSAADPLDTPSQHDAAPPAARKAAALHYEIGAGAVGSAGAAPLPTVGAEVFGAITWEHFALGLEGRADGASSSSTSSGASASVRLSLGTLSPCYAFGVLRVCALASVGALTAEGTGATVAQHSATSLYGAVGGRVGIDTPLFGPVALRVHADALAPLTRSTVRVGDEVLWETPLLSGALGIALAARWD
jgi:hypothetical protein